jgi:hypothetical protein
MKDSNSNIHAAKESGPIHVTRPGVDVPIGIRSAGTVYLRLSDCAHCVVCGRLVELLAFDEAAAVFNTGVQDIEYLANSREVHRLHNRSGRLMICSDSLFDCFDKRQTRLLDSHFAMDRMPTD